MKENYIYPAKVKKTEEGYEATVCDFDNAVTFGETKEELVCSLQEVIALLILDLDSRNAEIPKPSLSKNISLDEGEQVIFVHIWMPYYKNTAKEIYVKKTLTIPQWLDILAKEKKLNYSATLVKGIKAELGIER